MVGDMWSPAEYLSYADERERPFWDLVARVHAPHARHVVDLGCGPGTATARLLGHWPQATVLGIDSSPAMLQQAGARAVPGRLHFELADMALWRPVPGSLDVVLSNAALHWVPGHAELLGQWLAGLRPGGVLAFQVPGNFSAPSHVLLRELVASPRWRSRLSGAGDAPGAYSPAEYHRWLTGLGAVAEVWETTYYHALTGPDPVAHWLQGSALRPYLSLLQADDAAELLDSYAAAVREAYPPGPDGTTLFPFRRVFVVANVGRAG